MRFHKLDINLLVVMHHLLQGKSVSETAQLLHLTQPAVSNSLSRLRQHFDDPLFVALGRRLEPTPFARALTEPVSNALEDIERIIHARSDFNPAAAERIFTVVCSDYVYAVFVTRLIKHLAQIAPGVGVRTVLISEITGPLLDEGKTDFVIAPSPLTFPGHPRTSLFSESYSCIAWTGNQAIGERLTREQYLRTPHVGVSLGLNPPKRIEHVEEPPDAERPRCIVYTPTFSTLAETVVGTPYIATVHTRLARLFAERQAVRLLEMPVPADRFTECLQWHRNKDGDAGIIWLREQMAIIAADF